MNNNQLEMELLLEGIFRKYGYDFRNYSTDTAYRRVKQFMVLERLPNISAVQHKILHDSRFMDRLFENLSINVTEMFRDPEFYRQIKQTVIPIFKNLVGDQGHFKLWHAGCSSGEEVYSMCILLEEQDMLKKCLIYATDINNKVLRTAKRGIFPIENMQGNILNYLNSGGCEDFANYYVANYQGAMLHKRLSRNVVFSIHNLTTDHSFGEMNMITCRNVMIYFNRKLQDRVFNLFDDSLAVGGILCLGASESLQLSPMFSRYETLSAEHRIYRKL